MGWSTFRERVLKGKFNFVKKVESLDENRWVSRVMRDCRVRTSWRREIDRWKRREHLEEDWDRIGPREVKKRIEDSGLSRWQVGMESKSTLKWYRSKERPEALQWHVGDWSSKLLLKARTGTLEVKARKRDEQDQDCSRCRVRETIEHFLVECVSYEEERGRLLGYIESVIGVDEWHRRLVYEGGDSGILTVLGLYRGEEEEKRRKIIEAAKEFLLHAWGKRALLQ